MIHTLFHNILVCSPPILKKRKILIMHLNSKQIHKNAIQMNIANPGGNFITVFIPQIRDL